MKLTRERKFYVAVFLLALAALGADRAFFRGGPDEAGAAAPDDALLVPGTERTTNTSGRTAAGQTSSSGGAESITALLESIRQQRDLQLEKTPDVFAKTMTPGAALPSDRQIRANSLIEQFSKHRLTSVMQGSRGDAAMVDGQMVHVGQTFDRFKLISIDSQSALFECEDVQVCLTLGGESRATSSPAPPTGSADGR